MDKLHAMQKSSHQTEQSNRPPLSMQGGLLLLQTKQSKIKLTQNTQKPQTIPVNSRMVARGGAA
ncbi:hypothetical protein, partial [Phyllobacterium sophorae]